MTATPITHVLIDIDTVHTVADICDYLDERFTPDHRGTVTGVAVVESHAANARRDAEAAANVVRVRLAGLDSIESVTVEILEEDAVAGDVGTTLVEMALDNQVDEVVICTGRTRSPGVTPNTIHPQNGAVLDNPTFQQLCSELACPLVLVPGSDTD